LNLTIFAAASCSVSPVLELQPARRALASAECAKTKQLNAAAFGNGLRHNRDECVDASPAGLSLIQKADATASKF